MEKEVFRAGKWTDSSGRSREFTEDDLDKITATFNEKSGRNIENREVPLVIGHPNGEAPAFGVVEKLWRNGKKLFAKFKDIPEKMAGALKDDKRWRDVSISLNSIKDHVIQHVGLTNFPAVAGMGGFKFKHLGESVQYIANNDIEINGDLKIDEEKATGFVAWLKGLIKKEQEEFTQNQQQEKNNMSEKVKLDELQAKITELETNFTSLKDEKEKLTADFEAEKKAHTDLKADIAKKAEERQDKAEADFVAGLIESKKIYPRDKELHLHTLKSLRDSGEAEFTNGEGKKEKKNAYDHYKDRLSSQPELQEFEEMGKGEEKAKDAIDVKTREYMQANNITDESRYGECANIVISTNPELLQK